MVGDGAITERLPELVLPDLPEGKPCTPTLVRRGVSITLGGLGVLAVGTMLVLFFVRTEMTIDTRGHLEPVQVYPVRTLEPGMIGALLVGAGDTVRAGQPVAQLDTLALTTAIARLESRRRASVAALRKLSQQADIETQRGAYQIRQSEARLVRAQADLREARARFGVSQDAPLVAGTHTGLDRSLSAVLEAEAEQGIVQTDALELDLVAHDEQIYDAEIAELDAELAALRNRLDRLTIRAPAFGIVLTEDLERRRGEHVESGALLLEIGDPGQWRVRLQARGYDVHQVRPGQRGLIEIDALSVDERVLFAGQVVFVATDAAQPGSGPATAERYHVLVELDRDQTEQQHRAKFRRGYAVEGKIITETGTLLQIVLRRIRAGSSW